MNYDNRFNLFLNSKSEIEKRYICNYRKNNNENNLLEYSCNHNLYNWLKLINIYSNEDILEYYSRSDHPKLDIFKLLFKNYKNVYLQNIVLNSCNSEIIEFLLPYDNDNYFSFNILIETNKKDLLKMFIKYGYKLHNYEIEMLIMKNIVFFNIFDKIKDWIDLENKNLYYIFKYCNDIELIEFLKFSGINFNKFDDTKKDIFMYLCENKYIDISLILSVIKNINFLIQREDIFNNNALYYYCLNPNFNQEIYDFLIKLNLNLNKNLINKLLEITKNPVVYKNFESYDNILLPYKYDIDMLSNDLKTLIYFDEKYELYNFIDLNLLLFNIIEIGNFDCLKYILNKYPNLINLKDNYENSILDLICTNRYKNLDIITFLVNKGINVFNKNIFGFNCIFNLINSERVSMDIYKYILSFEKIIFTYNNNFESLYHVLCKLNYNHKYLEIISKSEMDINLLDKYKNSAINYAFSNNNIQNVRFFLKYNNLNLYTKNKLGLNTLDYFLKSKLISYKILSYFKNVTLKNIENYISYNRVNIKIFSYLISKLKNRYQSNYLGDNILLLICKTNMNNTKLKLKLLQILKNYKFNFNKLNKNNENSLILTMKYDQNYYIIKYLLNLKVSTFIRDTYGNNALIYSKDIRIYNLLNKYSIIRENNLGQNILIRLFNLNFLENNFIIELSKKYDIKIKDNLNKTILDYFIENNNDDIELFDYILKSIKLKSSHFNFILRNRNKRLCIYLLHKKILNPNYLDRHRYGILDYFSHDKEIISLLKYKYLYKIRNKNIEIIDKTILFFIDNIDEYIDKIEDFEIKKTIINRYKLKKESILNLLKEESLFETILNSEKNKLDDLYHEGNNILMILLKNNYKFKNIKLLLSNTNIDINYLNSENKNVLFYSHYDIDIFKYFVNLGCYYKIFDINYESILFNYVKNNYSNIIIKYLIEDCKLNVNNSNLNKGNMIFKTTNYDIIKLLLENGLDKKHKDNSGNTFLNYYLQQSNININIINLLINYGYNFNSLNNNHCTPLINYLKNNNSIYILSIILKYQNTINIKDLSGNTALMNVIKKGINKQLVDLLLKNNADPNILDNYNRNCLYYCNNDDYLPIIKELIKYKINYNLIVEQRNYLIYYTWWSMTETVKYFLDELKDIDLNFKDQQGNNVLFYAAGIYSEQGDLDIVKYLHQKGVNIRQINNDGYTLLFIAVGVTGYNYYDEDILKYLINYADFNHLDNESNSFINYLKDEYLENLIIKNIVDPTEPIIIEVIYSKNIKELMPFEIEYDLKDMKEKTCGICLQNFDSEEILNECQNNHTFHRECLIKWYIESKKLKCPYCTLKFTLNHKAIKCL
jgi:ankyrin repeat protein